MKPWRNKSLMQDLYIDKDLNASSIADKLGCSASCIYKWVGNHDLRGYKPWNDKGLVRTLYVEKHMTSEEVGDKLGCSSRTILNKLEEFGIEKRRVGQKQTQPHHYFNNQGYEHVRTSVDGEVKDMSIHRLNAVVKYGTDFLKDENKVVHHKNNIRWDNRMENLELMNNSEHVSQHAKSINRTRDAKGRFA